MFDPRPRHSKKLFFKKKKKETLQGKKKEKKHFLFLSVKAFFLFDKLPKEVWREDEFSIHPNFQKRKKGFWGIIEIDELQEAIHQCDEL